MKNILLIALICCFLGVAIIKKAIYSPNKLETETLVVVNKGATSGMVANKLASENVIKYPTIFKLFARIRGLDKNLKAGEYLFAPNMSMAEVMEQMNKGGVFYRKITLPEGLTTTQILQLIEDNEFLSGNISLSPREGDLLPETYSFVRGDSKDSIIIQAQKAMEKELENVWKERDKTVPIKKKGDLLVLASIIEKETSVASERGLVASVFVNRLRKRMRLQTDPTVIYALTNGKNDLGRPLLRKDLNVDSPYNTYKYYGLPPKPICNPGIESLKAASNPDVSQYLYFVANGDGGHSFATSLNEHNKNVANWKKQKRVRK